MSKRMPPLNPLRVFAVVAQTENLSAASRELHVTQSAVSRQIGVLESYLGVELLRRERHGVALTSAGKSYAAQISPAFGAIASATDRILKDTSKNVLRLRTYTTFAAKWLIPRLQNFKRLHPDIDVRITTAVPAVDFERDPVDAAIQYGDGKWTRTQTDLLFLDEIEPVCSDQILASVLGRPGLLLKRRLLVSHYRRTDWDDWLVFAGLQQVASEAERMVFSSSVLTWQAALDGLGIAIGQTALLETELKLRRLVRPFAMPMRKETGHFFVRPNGMRDPRRVRIFREWLLETT